MARTYALSRAPSSFYMHFRRFCAPTATHVAVAWSVRLSVSMHIVCQSVTLMHPATATGRNEMPFDRDTCGPRYLTEAPVPPREGEIWKSESSVRNDADYCQITLAIVHMLLPKINLHKPTKHGRPYRHVRGVRPNRAADFRGRHF